MPVRFAGITVRFFGAITCDVLVASTLEAFPLSISISFLGAIFRWVAESLAFEAEFWDELLCDAALVPSDFDLAFL